MALALLTWMLPVSTAQEEARSRLAQRVAALEHKLRYLTVTNDAEAPPEVRISGAKLRLVNGLGRTDCGTEEEPIPDCPNRVGNLIVGYNEPRAIPEEPEEVDAPNVRTGSHNVIVEKEHHFSRFGGIVSGLYNEISGDFSAVIGGAEDTVSGGRNNTANGDAAMISGGALNIASGIVSSIIGGRANTASGFEAVVCGGDANTASGDTSVVSGGIVNTASGYGSSVSGGALHTAGGLFFDSWKVPTDCRGRVRLGDRQPTEPWPRGPGTWATSGWWPLTTPGT